jgi:hypothetical protein
MADTRFLVRAAVMAGLMCASTGWQGPGGWQGSGMARAQQTNGTNGATSGATRAKTMAAERAANSYAIYSMLLPGEPFSGMSPEQVQHLGIAATTVNMDDMNPRIPPDSQLTPPPGNEKAFLDAVQDFRSRRLERVQLKRNLQLDRDYTLLSPDQINELKQVLAGVDPGSELQARWAGYPGITYFSEVYFNPEQTAALVYMGNYCANLCANGTWVYLEKRDEQWVRRSGLNI